MYYGDALTIFHMIGQVLNHDYAALAKKQGVVVDLLRNDDLFQFPIERARFRTSKYSVPICTLLLASYGWALQVKSVRCVHLCIHGTE